MNNEYYGVYKPKAKWGLVMTEMYSNGVRVQLDTEITKTNKFPTRSIGFSCTMAEEFVSWIDKCVDSDFTEESNFFSPDDNVVVEKLRTKKGWKKQEDYGVYNDVIMSIAMQEKMVGRIAKFGFCC